MENLGDAYDLSGKTALITGSRKGIGFAIARTLAQAGASVIINGTVDPISSNLSRYTNFGVNYLSATSGMSVTSGIWTFPTTGYWRIFFKFQGERQGGHQSAYQQLRISTSTDSGSSYNLAAIAEGTYYDNYNATRKTGGSASLVFDVTNVGTHKVKFHTLAEDNSGNGNLFVGHSSIGVTTFEFIKLTDT